jgi:hypothetical protein
MINGELIICGNDENRNFFYPNNSVFANSSFFVSEECQSTPAHPE